MHRSFVGREEQGPMNTSGSLVFFLPGISIVLDQHKARYAMLL